ncbi:MAG: pilus assembly protein PilX, partial [Gammaproteobacteria bacterium]|nr:pilus assembly protein PilX [Gammaproteobacteria bacterium]
MLVTHSIQYPGSAPGTQRGAVLIISLLILLVLTVIGINSMDGSIMEQKMATNSRDSAATFQEAESAIRNTFF